MASSPRKSAPPTRKGSTSSSSSMKLPGVAPRLVLRVLEARDVGLRAENGAAAPAPTDVFCQVTCGGDTVKTEVIEDTTHPQWEQDVTFGGGGGGAALGDRVHLRVLAYGRLGRDDCLGEATLAISGLPVRTSTQHVLPLRRPNSGDAAVVVGELVVESLYDPDFVPSARAGGALPTLSPTEPSRGAAAAKAPGSASASVSTTATPTAGPHRTPPASAPTTTTTSTGPVVPAPPATAPAPASAVVARPPPNSIVVTLLEAKELMALDGKGEDATSDPFVKLSCTKNASQKSKVHKKTLHPKWRQRFYFYLTPGRQVLDLVVEDNDMFQNDFMGNCSIDLEQWRAHIGEDKRVLWLALEPRRAKGDISVSDISPERNLNYGYGKICVAIEFRYIEKSIESLEQGELDHDTVVPSSKATRATPGDASGGIGSAPPSSTGNAGSVQGDEGGDLVDAVTKDDDDDGDRASETGIKETDEEIKKREEERQKMFAELSNVQFASGDYQIRVRIIEVRDLKPMDANGSCDPVVSVECLGQRQHTMVKTKQLSCVFDEILFFNFKHLDKDTVQQGSIKVTVLDADGPGNMALSRSNAIARLCSDTIGFFNIDIPYIYFQKHHEIHRKWVALVGSGKTNSDQIQGYMLLSIVVLGPGDKIQIHPPEQSREQENVPSTAFNNAKDINSLVLIPPRVTQSLSYLVVTIYEAQDLPNMDQGLLKTGGVDAYAKVLFSGQDVLETKKVTVKGSKNLCMEFNQELWFPVMLPSMSTNIFVSLWDWDLTTDELVGNTEPFNFALIQKYPHLFTPHWVNIYGPPVGYVKEPAARKYMFDNPKVASSYRGRMLLSFRMEDGSKSVNDRPHTRNLTSPMPLVPTKSYTLRAALFFGTEIPMFVSKTSWNRNSKMALKISIGKYEVKTTRVDNVKGMCHWNQYIEIPDVTLPSDLEHVPDVFIHLIREQLNETRYICYARFRAKDILLSPSSLTSDELKTIPAPSWVSLIEDPVMNDLKDHDFTGNVLMNIRLEPTPTNIIAKDLGQKWRDHATKALTYTKYTLFTHVFQGRSLPAADDNGLLDPYVKVSCGGAEGKVNKRKATRDPCFYETVCLDIDLPQDTVFLPKVSVQVFDWDQWDADDYVGAAKFSLSNFHQMSSSQYNKQRASGEYAPPTPKWYPIAYTTPGDTEGELLLSFELIRKETPGVVVEPPESIRPPMEDRFLEITCLGCRGLQPVGFMPVNTPFAKFEVGEFSKTNGVRFTNPSSKPSGRNPNFLERIVIPVKMPVDALYAPRLNISVYDQLLGGFYKPLLGVCSVDLSTKMPMSNGQPNPLFVDVGGSLATGNPYIEKPTNFSTFPGTVPPVMLSDASSSKLKINKRQEEETKEGDIGAGAIPPVSNLASTTSYLSGADVDDDDVPHYLRHRTQVDGALEDNILRPPFETYHLFRGDMLKRRKFFGGGACEADFRSVGRFKGVIRFLKRADEPAVIDLDQFLTPQPYLVRIYVLDAINLTPKDENNKCDPYLRISIGDGRKRHHIINDRDNYRKETLAPKFHKMYEFKAELPGASELRIELLDYDFFAIPGIPSGLSNGLTAVGSTVGGDDFVGATMIDLEDRWFSTTWQRLGVHPDIYEKHKPVELRPLYAPFSTLPQGSVRLWVDILTPHEMSLCKPVDVSLPPIRHFEVRVIVYRAKNVTPGDFTDLSDLFVKCWLQDRHHKAQTTDTHWRARDGKASFNWRMKFDIDLPIEEDNEADKGYLHFQMWDKDVLYDDCLADTVVDLSVFLKQAYKTNQVVNVFAKKKEVRMRSLSSGIPASTSGYQPPNAPLSTGSVAVDVNAIDDLKRPLLADAPRSDREASATGASQTAVSGPPQSQRPSKKGSEKRKETAESLVKSIKQRLGMGDDPEDASWLTFTTRDPTSDARVRAGELLVSVEILPVAVANARAAGLGRSEPNNFPVLAEPADRLHLSAMWNPLYVMEALMGPKFYAAFSSAVVCVLVIALLIFAGPLVNVFVTMIELIPPPYGWIVFGIALAVVILTTMYFTYRCRRAISASMRGE